MAFTNDKKRRLDSPSRSSAIEALIQELATARGAGESVDYSEVEEKHQDLMPELGDRLRLIRAMEMAAVSPNDASAGEEDAESTESDQNSAAEFLREALEGYEILEQVDYGGQGRVFKAIQTATNRTVAIKILLDGPLASKRHRDRFLREIELVSRLKDPGIVTVYDSGTLRDRPYLVMEFVDGLPIDDYVCAERPDVKGRIQLFLQVCHAIAAAHRRGIIHRDLKPANILVDGSGRVHVLDFGLAKEIGDPSHSGTRAVLSQTGLIVGTLCYLSPEQAWGQSGSVDTRSDVYTLGVVLFELLTGLPPYPTNGPREQVLHRIRCDESAGLRKAIAIAGGDGVVEVKHIDRDLETILTRCLTKEPERRYQSVTALSDDLERYLRGDVIEARAASSLYVLQKTFRKFRVHVTIAAAFLVLILAALVGMSVLYNRANDTARIAYAGLLVGNFVREAERSVDKRQIDQAIGMLEAAVEVGEGIPHDDPLVRRQIFTAHHDLANLYIEAGRQDEAVEQCDMAMELSDALQMADPEDLEWVRLVGFSQKLRARAASENREWDRALQHFKESLSIRKQLAALEPQNTHWQVELSNAYVSLGKVAQKLELWDDALTYFMEAHGIDRRVLTAEPSNIRNAVHMASTEINLGRLHLSCETDHGDAQVVEWYARADDRLMALPKSPDLKKWEGYITDLYFAIDAGRATLHANQGTPNDDDS